MCSIIYFKFNAIKYGLGKYIYKMEKYKYMMETYYSVFIIFIKKKPTF